MGDDDPSWRPGCCWVDPLAPSPEEAVACIVRQAGLQGKTDEPARRKGWRWEPITSEQLASTDHQPTWLVQRLLVKGEPCIVAGPPKVLKTSVAIDMAVSLASGADLLGMFKVDKPVRVAYLSGESGPFVTQETAARVARAKGQELAGLNVLWMFNLPALADPGDLRELSDGLHRDGVEVVFIDPLYVCLLAGAGQRTMSASNLFDMGMLLHRLRDACLAAKTTPIFLHHTSRPSSRSTEPLELADMAFAGLPEFAAQWLLLSRRELEYKPGEPHKLWMNAGGRCDQGGQWSLDITTGVIDDDFGGRTWAVSLMTASEERDARKERRAVQREEKKRGQDGEDDFAVLGAVDRLAGRGKAATRTAVAEAAGVPKARSASALERLAASGELAKAEEEVPTGKGATRATTVFRRPRAGG